MNQLAHIRCMRHWHHHLEMELLQNMMIFSIFSNIFGIVFIKIFLDHKSIGKYYAIEKKGFTIILNVWLWNFYHLCFYQKHEKQASAFINPQSAHVSVFIYKWNFGVS